jgi:predicted molibdopterin-dependent oxidoreductase YjgC
LEAVAQLAGVLNKETERQVRYLPLATYNNSIGSVDMGLKVNGHSLMKSFGSSIQALYLAGSNPVEAYGKDWENALKKLSFLAVAELFMTETAKLADVVFPVNSFAEQDGTFTNNATQVQRVYRALEGAGQVRPDWMVLNALAREMRVDIGAKGSSVSIFRDVVAETSSYNGITYERIKKESAVSTSRTLIQAKAASDIAKELASECSKINTNIELNKTNVAQGEGLFRVGTMAKRSPVIQDAFGKKEENLETVTA